jgi:hypothetical protein
MRSNRRHGTALTKRWHGKLDDGPAAWRFRSARACPWSLRFLSVFSNVLRRISHIFFSTYITSSWGRADGSYLNFSMSSSHLASTFSHFWIFNIFINFEILCVHVSLMLVQSLSIIMVNSLSKMELSWICNRCCNQPI